MQWVNIGEPLNGYPWKFKIDKGGVIIQFASPCGNWLKKTASADFVLDLMECSPDVNDLEQCKLISLGLIDDDELPATLLGAADNLCVYDRNDNSERIPLQ